MSFIRNRSEERTGIQNGSFPPDCVDMHCDFVMVYRLDDTCLDRIRVYKEKGYVIHFMTGISWGSYIDYLEGEYDGKKHWDEAQTDRFGNQILHSPRVPYMVPTLSFTDYITQKLKKIVDAGVEAIHVEEPEFWDRAGYSEGFQREFELYYKKKWTPPHKSAEARYECARLKAFLFARCIDRLSASLKAYAKITYNKDLRFYVPTHSLINYTQWKIVSPEGKLADLPNVDGCIAQVWTGTSREKNWYEGVLRERTFETAYLEYGVMQELVKGTGRKMWFLHDPIEDNPAFDWEDYRKNYLCTVAASLLHPSVNSYEISPWPNRVFEGKYPKGAPDAVTIPAEYATILNNMFNTLGTLESGKQTGLRVGILTGDCELYQRGYPDCEFSEQAKEVVGTVLPDDEALLESFKTRLFTKEEPDKELMLQFMESSAFPAFYSLALPLLKHGVGVRPVLLDNARRYPGYLDDYDVLILSYEFMKPDYPDMNLSIAEWVRSGGTLLYVGNGFDPYHKINSWWTGKYETPAEHLYTMLGIKPEKEQEIFTCSKGTVGVWQTDPCRFSFNKQNANSYREFAARVVKKAGKELVFGNRLQLLRERYLIAAVLDESVSNAPAVFSGLFADMFTPDFAIVTQKTVQPGENTMLCDLTKVSEPTAVIGTSVRILALSENENGVSLTVRGASDLLANIRIKLPFAAKKVTVDNEPCQFTYDPLSRTVLLTFKSRAGERNICIQK